MGTELGTKRDRGPVPPYLPYATLNNFLGRLRVGGLPSRIDKSLMSSMSGASQTHLMTALKYLGLVTPAGTPTDKLVGLLNSEGAEREQRLRAVLEAAYPNLFTETFSLQTATARQMEEEFQKTATGGTVQKCVAFFTAAAKDAGISLSQYIGKGSRTPRTATARTKRVPATNGKGAEPAPEAVSPSPMGWSQMLLSKFPSFDPTWPDEVKVKWFDAFDKLMKRGDQPGADD